VLPVNIILENIDYQMRGCCQVLSYNLPVLIISSVMHPPKLRVPAKPLGDANNPDGTLKEADEMTWPNSPSDECPPAASPPCERKFSSATLTDNDHCQSLQPDTFSSIQLLKAQYKSNRMRQEMEAKKASESLKRKWMVDDAPESVKAKKRFIVIGDD
jgi:hypothetical protein